MERPFQLAYENRHISGAIWDVEQFNRLFLHVSRTFQRRKKWCKQTGFWNKLNLTCEAQSTPKIIGIFIKVHVFCTSGPNLVILDWIGDELWCRQVQNGVKFYFEIKFDLEGQGQSPPKTIGILKVFYTSGANLVIPAWTGHTLSHRQAGGWPTYTDTNRQTQITTIPEGQNWPCVKGRNAVW